MASAEGRRVLVVGAGLAGLAAAWELVHAGLDVQVVERSARAGGRIGGEWRDGFCLDRSLQTLNTGDRHLLAWIGQLGLRDDLLPLRPLQLAQLRGSRSATVDSQSLFGVAAIPGVSWRDVPRLLRWGRLMARYRRLLDPVFPERAAPLDFRSVEDFARLYFGRSCYERWIAPEVTEVFGGDAHELSRVAILLTWMARGTGAERSVMHGIARRGLHELPAAVAERLSPRFLVEVTRVDEAPAGGFTVECVGRAGRREILESDAVVLATSAAEAGRLAATVVSPAERDYLSAVRQRPEITLAAALDRPPCGMPQLLRVPPVEGSHVDAILLEPGIAEGRAPIGRGLATLRASERFARANAAASDEVVEKGMLASLERAAPEAARSVRLTRLCRREAGMPSFDVGAYRALERFRRVQRDRRSLVRRLYFAGDYLIGASAEASVVAGLRAARDYLSDCARRA